MISQSAGHSLIANRYRRPPWRRARRTAGGVDGIVAIRRRSLGVFACTFFQRCCHTRTTAAPCDQWRHAIHIACGIAQHMRVIPVHRLHMTSSHMQAMQARTPHSTYGRLRHALSGQPLESDDQTLPSPRSLLACARPYAHAIRSELVHDVTRAAAFAHLSHAPLARAPHTPKCRQSGPARSVGFVVCGHAKFLHSHT
jgi:hypothetical protein